MTAPTQYYVDPSLGSDTGDGSKATPWGRASGSVIQYALDNITRDATYGDQINVKGPSAEDAGTDDVLSSGLDVATTYGASGMPTTTAPLIIRGYGTDENDGTRAGISGGGSVSYMNASSVYDNINLIDLHIHSFVNYCVFLDNNCSFVNLKLSGSANGIFCDNYNLISGCEFYDITGRMLDVDALCMIRDNYFKNHASNKATDAIFIQVNGNIVERNIISVDGSTNGITISNVGNWIRHNTIYGGGSGTGAGILFDAATHDSCEIANNIISGFGGAGGDGIDFASLSVPLQFYGGNAFYNNTANETNAGQAAALSLPGTPDNEALAGDPFAKSGSDTFANRFTYFSPNDVGNVQGGAYVGP